MSHVEEVDEELGESAFEISWLEILLVVAGLALTFQIWPNFYFKSADVIYDSLDLTTWGWRSYAVANVVAFIALAAIRLRQNQR
ncbi:MAG TPA: hypothetical protein VHY91_12365 [Pirellulales bacterium]|jgi:hypothetical protein|nr:hypothetical protein [Pirellulales bacterium]